MSVLFPADSINGRSPVGAVQAYYGTSDPEEGNWLVCDGRDTTGTAIELAAVYPKLYRFLGNSNVLPDLRGEFLRGAGKNSHAAQGSGGAVGTHQDATEVPAIYMGQIPTIYTDRSNKTVPSNPDFILSKNGYQYNISTGGGFAGGNIISTVRPTNTSVNWIICAR